MIQEVRTNPFFKGMALTFFIEFTFSLEEKLSI